MSRMTISLSDAVEHDLDEITEKRGVTKSEALRNAIVLYKVLLREVANGNKLTVADNKDKVIKEIVMAAG